MLYGRIVPQSHLVRTQGLGASIRCKPKRMADLVRYRESSELNWKIEPIEDCEACPSGHSARLTDRKRRRLDADNTHRAKQLGTEVHQKAVPSHAESRQRL